MSSSESDLEPVRERTDLGLDQERARTDATLGLPLGDEENRADLDTEVRRADADEAMRARRVRADALLRESQSLTSPDLPAGVVEAARELADGERQRERHLADSIVERERQRADDVVDVDRETRRMVDELLGLERAETDSRLRLEREKTDEIVEDADALLADEQARSKKALAQRDDFLAIVSHELRNPLSAIALGAYTLLDPARPGLTDRATREIAEDVHIACAQMTRLVGDLLDGVSIESGGLTVNPVQGDARRVIHDAVAMSTAMLRRQSLSVTVEETPGQLLAQFDHPRLLQVFANLFANAAKFTAPGGTISVSVAPTGTSIRFCVADTGCGIAQEDTARVFDRFWQRDRRDRRGLGLGLYICKGIVEAHGGRIWVSSEPGAGSRFFFTVPAAVPTGHPKPVDVHS